MRRPLPRLLTAIGLALLYLVIFPIGAGSELIVDRAWVTAPFAAADAEAAGSRAADAEPPLLAVNMPGGFAYLTSNGRAVYRGAGSYGLALSPDGFVQYGRMPDQLVLQGPDGSYTATITQSGYARYADGDLFVVDGLDAELTARTADGALRWREALEAPLTVLRSDDGLTLAGTLAGGPVVLSESGERVPIDGLGGQGGLVVYGGDIDTASGTVAAAIGPADPTLTVFGLQTGRYLPLLQVGLSETPGGRIPVELSEDGSYVFADDGRVLFVRIETGEGWAIPMNHDVRAIEPDGFLVTALGLGQTPDPQRGFRFPGELVFFDREAVTPVRLPLAADHANLLSGDGRLFLILDDRVLSLSVHPEESSR